MSSETSKQLRKKSAAEKSQKKKAYASPSITYEEDVREVVQSGGNSTCDRFRCRRRRRG